jgi:hypothetical protein
MSEVRPTAAEVGAAIKEWGRDDPRVTALTVARVEALIASEVGEEPMWWWLSFATQERFLGLALVHAAGYMTAVVKARELGINPGGEVAGWPIPAQAGDPPEEYQHTLLDKDTADHLAEHGWETGETQ